MMHVKLPWELVEEILYRVPPLSFIRFRTVCKQWNTFFNDKTFMNKHLALVCPQFLVWTNSKIYSVSINFDDDPKIEMRELLLDIPYVYNHMTTHFIPCDGLLFCVSRLWENGVAVWNPCLRQSRRIDSVGFTFGGIGYDSGAPEKGHKIYGYGLCQRNVNEHTYEIYRKFAIYEFETNAWKSINVSPEEERMNSSRAAFEYDKVSLNGNLYWVTYSHETGEYLIESFDFSKEVFKIFCVLPWKENSINYPILSVFKGNRLSVLNKFFKLDKIEIWVTKNKINEDVENVVWMKFMTVSKPIKE